MTNVPEKMSQKRVLLPDGRYLIFYTFAPADSIACLRPVDANKDAKVIKSAEEN